MATVLLALLMQYSVAPGISDVTKTGLVNYLQGMANVDQGQTIQPSQPVRTGPNGFGEILLVPGSFLRIGENTEVVLDRIDLLTADIRLNRGAIVVEVVQAALGGPMKVTTGQLSVEIADAGIYRFDDNGTATVIEGRLLTINPKIVYKKGWQLSYSANYRAKKVSQAAETALDVFSRKRSQTMAAANANVVPMVMRTAFNPSSAQWLCSYGYQAMYSNCTFLPEFGLRSPYGFYYQGFRYNNGSGYRNGQTTASNNGNGNGTSTAPPPSNMGGGSNSAPPTPGTVAVPAGERTTAGEYSSSKAPSAGAQQPPPRRH